MNMPVSNLNIELESPIHNLDSDKIVFRESTIDSENDEIFCILRISINYNNFLKDLKEIQRNNSSFLQGIPDEEWKDAFLKTFFPEGLSTSINIFKSSEVKDRIEYSFRMNVTPKMEKHLRTGYTLLVKAVPSNYKTSTLEIEKILEVKDIQVIESEMNLNIRFFHNNLSQINSTTFNLLNMPQLVDMKSESFNTEIEINKWLQYIDWRINLYYSKLKGIYYNSYTINSSNQSIEFRCFVDKKTDLESFRRQFMNKPISVYPKDISIHPIDFIIQKKYNVKKSGKSFLIGKMLNFKKLEDSEFENEFSNLISESMGKKSNSADDEMNAELNSYNCIHLEFSLNVEELLDQESNDNNDEVLDPENIVYPKGFLLNSQPGDLTLLKRHHKSLTELLTVSNYQPYLLNFLFDVNKLSNLRNSPLSKIEWVIDSLNDKQKSAVRKILEMDHLVLILGPPGTGKTTVITEAIHQLIQRKERVLILSQANLAVDNVLERLKPGNNVRAIRLGSKDKISDSSKKFDIHNAHNNLFLLIEQDLRENYSDIWDRVDKETKEISSFLENYKIISQDLEESKNIISIQNQKLDDLSNNLKAIIEEENKLKEENEINQELAQSIQTFCNSFSNYSQITLLPENILEIISTQLESWNQSLFQFYIDRFRTIEEPTSNTKLNIRTLVCLQKIKKFSEIFESAERLNLIIKQFELSGSISNTKEVEDLKHQLSIIEEKMIGDEFLINDWRKLKSKITQLSNEKNIFHKSDLEIFNLQYESKTLSDLIFQDPNWNKERILEFIKNFLNFADLLRSKFDSFFSKIREDLSQIQIDTIDFKKLNETKSDISRQIRITEEQKKGLKSQINQYKINLNLLIEKYKIYIPADCPNGFEFNYLSKRFEALNEENNKNQFIRDNFEKFIRKYQIELRNQIESSLETDSIQEIQKKYLQSCNIVGMSCNANPNLLNDLEIQSFDVCIIDEVSKASFPELLLAFKISKKVVLVGDHRQLPPVFNEKIQSYKELMDHQSEGESESLITIENFKKFEKMIKNSFFKLSFENADERMKENLNVQFRMHVEIMNIVNQFYENTLLSGYTKEESDRIKDHKITIKGINNIELISPQKHVVWLDSSKEPNGNRYYETQNGTSKENHLEAAIIVNLLIKLNNEYSKLGFDEKRRKEVGVISFYGKQIGLLRKIVDKNKLKSLDIDINTVDKFQGKEKPIIIVSIVRNLNISKSAKIYNPEKPSHIAEYERINVAFSRAQELLIITGSKDMLYDYEVPLPELSGNKVNPKYVYKNILNSINYAGNLFESNSILTSEDFKLFCGKIPGANPGKKNLNGRKM